MGACCGSTQKRKSVELTEETKQVIIALFNKIDADGDKELTRAEAMHHWKNFSKANADMMFGQTDEDKGNTISMDEYLKYWKVVAESGYSQEEIREEVELMMEGEAWKNWGRVSISKMSVEDKGKNA